MPVYLRNASFPMSEEQLKGLLKRYDTNGDGRLSRKELQSAFRSLGLHFSGFRARRAMRNADADEDGFITDDEMKQLVMYAAKWGFTLN